MHQIKNPDDLTSIKEALQYIHAYISKRDELSDEKVAASIVGLGISNHYNDWIKEAPALDEIMALASDLEWSNGDAETLESYWVRISELETQLASRYA